MTKNTKTVLGWCFYDFANQPFTTIVVTFIYSAYFVGGINSETGLAGGIVGSSAMGQVYWGNITAICAVIIALLSPIMGAAADQGGHRKSFLLFWTWICIIFSILLFFPTYGDIYTALILFAIANIAFEMGSVFCNSYVSDISERMNLYKRLSALKKESEIKKEFKKIQTAVNAAVKLGLTVNAGHGLTYKNVVKIASIQAIEEFNIGHNIVARAVMVGLDRAVKEMIEAINQRA